MSRAHMRRLFCARMLQRWRQLSPGYVKQKEAFKPGGRSQARLYRGSGSSASASGITIQKMMYSGIPMKGVFGPRS